MHFKVFRKKKINSFENYPSELKKNLSLADLVALGIAAIIGAGVFGTIGTACAAGGPAVSLLFIFTAIACAFSALCYAEFASAIPVAGSAYTYAYVAFGEIIAWIIGWDLIIEYAIGNIAVAISWSDYFTSLLEGFGLQLPPYLTTDFLTAYRVYNEIFLKHNIELTNLAPYQKEALEAWINAPTLGKIKLIFDLPALSIISFISYLVYVGISESKTASNIMVAIKLLVLLLVIAIGIFYVNPQNWTPFAPHGFSGVMKGVAAVFFAYIGFDALSTTAEECQDAKKDLPRAMILALLICSVLYILISLVLTGMVPYHWLKVGDPLAFAFEYVHMEPKLKSFIKGIISVSAVVAMASVLLVFQLGQPRIWMSISRDGLLPSKFSHIHPKYRTPTFSTLIAALLVAIPALFMNLTEVTDLSSFGTLFAFTLVCGGVLKLQGQKDHAPKFKVPYINGKYILPLLYFFTLFFIFHYHHYKINKILDYFYYKSVLELVPPLIFWAGATFLTFLTWLKNLSLIPVLGILSCFYLMSQVNYRSWILFSAWLAIGLIIYFAYSYKNSKLAE
ncbi:MAG: amino acid permease [Bacteroidia bacterium]|nr:amino acid permease [Bacteroidia bacterium]MDW8158307.1 amino acid permease [Bacteroidia bacterium]